MAGQIVCFGELLLRLGAPGRELLFQTPRLEVQVGGAEANVAVALACLGHPTRMVSRVPDNLLGEAALGHLRRYGVDVGGIARAPGRMGLYFLSPGAGLRRPDVVYDREGSAFAQATAADFDWEQLLAGADLLHLSGITAALGAQPAETAIAAAEAARARGIELSFDGNYRAQLWRRWNGDSKQILGRLVEQADILFGNHRDISLLLGRTVEGEGEARRQAAAAAAFAAFPNLKLIASTARLVDDSETHRLSARIDTRDGAVQTDEIVVAGIVDRIGAGDAFAAGVLHARRLGLDPDAVARHGLALACLKHSLPGDAALFGRETVAEFLAGERDVRR
jgi:2-dehydro-3-deoxygluconokinase